MTPRCLLALFCLALPAVGQSRSTPKAAVPNQASAPPPASQEGEAPKPNWNGTWLLVSGESESLDTRVEEFTKDMNFVQKQLWKRKLAKACKGYGKFLLLGGEVFSISFDKELPLNTSMDGSGVTWTLSDGTRYEVTGARKDSSIVQTFQGDGYTLSYTYLIRKDGQTLVLQTLYNSSKLPDSFLFKQIYRRNN